MIIARKKNPPISRRIFKFHIADNFEINLKIYNNMKSRVCRLTHQKYYAFGKSFTLKAILCS